MANYEEIFLNALRKNHESVEIKDVTGQIHKGRIVAFDPFCVICEPMEQDKQVLFRKENIVSIEPIRSSVGYIFMDLSEGKSNGGRHE
jgi:sRNA-binding regulator protein Hfq